MTMYSILVPVVIVAAAVLAVSIPALLVMWLVDAGCALRPAEITPDSGMCVDQSPVVRRSSVGFNRCRLAGGNEQR